MPLLLRLRMQITIDFNDKFAREDDEIGDVGSDRRLAPCTQIIMFQIAQETPQCAFTAGLIPPKPPGMASGRVADAGGTHLRTPVPSASGNRR